MKKTKSRDTIIMLLILILSFSVSEAQHTRALAFTHVNVIPMNKEVVLKDYTVIVKQGKIEKLGKSGLTKIPAGARIINAKGKFMIPSLSDMHVHLEGDAWNMMFPPAGKFTMEEINFEDILFLYLANGISIIDILSALPEHIPLREKINNNEIPGPRLILSRMLDGAGKAWPPPICTWINNADEAKTAVKEIQKNGYDRIKVYSFLDKPSYDTIIAEAKRLKIPVDGHVPYSTSVEHVASSGQSMIAHMEEIMKFAKSYNAEQVSYFSSQLANSGIWVTSALILNRNLNALLKDPATQLSKPGTEYLHPMAQGIWKFVYEHNYKPMPEATRADLLNGYDSFLKPFVREFSKKGGKILIGTDALVPCTIPGISLHEELEEFVDAGLSPFAALKIATTNTYEFLGESEKAGTIEVGKFANLLLLDKNPLENISNTKSINGIFIQDKWISKKEIDTRLKEISVRYARMKEDKLKLTGQ
jgi:imidazolonepropionase-like amidohydrolase